MSAAVRAESQRTAVSMATDEQRSLGPPSAMELDDTLTAVRELIISSTSGLAGAPAETEQQVQQRQ